VDLLCDYPDQWALLDQLELVPHAVGEAMRYRPIGVALPRIATDYLELAGSASRPERSCLPTRQPPTATQQHSAIPTDSISPATTWSAR